MSEYIKVCEVEKYYGEGSNVTKAVDGVSFDVDKGEFVGIMGASGSGKSTLLNMMSTIDKVTAGHIYYGETDITGLNEDKLSDFRRDNLGFVFQDFNLLDTLTIGENVALAMTFHTKRKKEIKEKVDEMLNLLGISGIRDKFPYQVSGGQKQRCACARALINNPSLLLADEPTQLVQHYPKTTPVIFWSLSILISLMTERQRVRFSSRVKVSYIFLKSFCNSFSTAAKSGGASCVVSGIWFNAAVYIS